MKSRFASLWVLALATAAPAAKNAGEWIGRIEIPRL